jgi:ferredoxin-NADP reductase
MNRWFDRLTGKIPMYKLVVILLVALTVIAIVLSLLGQLTYSPLELLATLAVALVATVASSWLVAKLFRVAFHVESAIITGYLLFFVLIPTLEVSELLIIALAAVIASASKFLLAWRGRHIFNPAALGAFVVTALGLTFSGWWAATSVMLPFVAIAAFLILQRTRRLAMGLVFIVLAAGIEITRFTLNGSDLGEALQIAFFSTAIVFLAGFMLSEPLTLPPRRWQQLTIAVVVAVLFAVPFTLGPVYSSPQLALLVGNLVAFFFGQRRGIALEFLGKTQLTPSTWEFSFQPKRSVRFRAGQFMELTLPHKGADFRGSRRIFSISSAPAPGAPVTFAMTISDPPSSFKKALLELEPGTRIHGTSVGGDFALPADPAVPVLLVAGGIGITPFSSQLADAAANAHDRDAVVVYAVTDSSSIAYADVLASSGARVILVAPTAPTVLPPNFEYAGPARISKELLAASVPDLAERRAFVSGPPALVSDVRGMLRALGSRRVTSDYFSGY